MVAMPDVSIPGVMPSDVATGRRPRNRKQTIAKVAPALFAEQGFSVVRMDHIAAASGATVRALYRHFDNKLSLLTDLVESSQELFLPAVEGAAREESDPARRFGAAVQRLAIASEDTAHFAVLCQREARHLETADYSRLRERLTSMVRRIGEMIGHVQPELSDLQRELRAWATIAVMVTPRNHTGTATAIEAAMTFISPAPPSALRVTAIELRGSPPPTPSTAANACSPQPCWHSNAPGLSPPASRRSAGRPGYRALLCIAISNRKASSSTRWSLVGRAGNWYEADIRLTPDQAPA